MKNLIKELAKREGLKSQVKIGDLRETMSKFNDMLAEEMVDSMINQIEMKDVVHPKYTADFCSSLIKKCNAILKKKKRSEVFNFISFDNNVGTNLGTKKKVKA